MMRLKECPHWNNKNYYPNTWFSVFAMKPIWPANVQFPIDKIPPTDANTNRFRAYHMTCTCLKEEFDPSKPLEYYGYEDVD